MPSIHIQIEDATSIVTPIAAKKAGPARHPCSAYMRSIITIATTRDLNSVASSNDLARQSATIRSSKGPTLAMRLRQTNRGCGSSPLSISVP